MTPVGDFSQPCFCGWGGPGPCPCPNNKPICSPPVQSQIAPDLAAALARELAAALVREHELREAIRWAHDTLWELNPSNYDHDEVCKVNDAAVEVILGLAPFLGETHGKSSEWWAERSALGDRA